MNIDISQAETWSRIDEKPVLYYNEHHAAWLACWNGIHLTAEQAFAIASVVFWGVRLTPSVRLSLTERFEQLYFANAFNTTSWRFRNKDITAMQHELLRPHLIKISTKYKDYEIMEWFEKILKDE